MFKNETKKQMMAVAVAAMFMLCAFSACIADNDMDAADNDGNSYIIGMRVGDTFNYLVSTNLTGAEVEHTTDMNQGMVFTPANNGGTLSGSYATAGKYSNVLTANWSQHNLTQTATQQIDFQIVNKINLEDSAAPGADASFKAALNKSAVIGTEIYTPGFKASSPQESTWGALSVDVSSVPNGSAGDFEYKDGVIKTAKALSEGTYVLTLPANYSIAVDTTGYNNTAAQAITDSAKLVITVAVAEDFTFSIEADTYTYVDNAAAVEITPVVENAGNATITWALDATSAASRVFSLSQDGGVITVNDGSEVIKAIDGDFKEYSGTLTASGAKTLIAGAEPIEFEVTKSFKVTVYKNLAFTSEPTVGEVRGYHSSVNPLDALISMNVGCANKVIFNWGDNTAPQTQILNGSESSVVTGAHTYAAPGTYLVTVKAYNNFGNTAAVIMYNADGEAFTEPAVGTVTVKNADGSSTLGTATVNINSTFRISQIQIASGVDFTGKKIVALYTEAASNGAFDATKKWINSTNIVTDDITLYAEVEDTTPADDFFAEHGWLFILFGVLTILGLVAIFYFGYQSPVVIALTVFFVIMAVLCFMYKDFNGIIEAIQNLFGMNNTE